MLKFSQSWKLGKRPVCILGAEHNSIKKYVESLLRIFWSENFD